MTHQEYDGIEEHNNPLPSWWLMIFLGTIIFSFLYLIHYTVGGGKTQAQELAAEMALLPKSTSKVWTEEQLKMKFDSSDTISAGGVVFSQKCASCHAVDGGGLIGPNLCDSYWIHGQGDRVGVIEVIAKGVLEKGMPAWEALITEEELLQVSSFVYSLHGKKPLQAKAPEGVEHAR